MESDAQIRNDVISELAWDPQDAAAAGSPFAAQGLGPFGSEYRPTNPAQLYVSNAHNGGNAGTVSAFTVSADGTLNPIGTSPYQTTKPRPAGSRSATTAGISSPSTPAPSRSRATRSRPTARSACSKARR
jgi:hypothetical protein